MDTSDEAHGFRAIEGTRLRLAVARKPQMWDEARVYDVPRGYHWASTVEAEMEVLQFCTEQHAAYFNQAGWNGCEWPPKSGQYRDGFVFADSIATGKAIRARQPVIWRRRKVPHSMHWDNNAAYAREEFAGLVCIRNGG